MRRMIIGGAGALALAGAGLFLWQGYAQEADHRPATGIAPPELAAAPKAGEAMPALTLPVAAAGAPKRGAAPPRAARSDARKPGGPALQPL